MLKSKSGFTIVELLIVIVVIGILAAITIVAYNGIQQRATASSVSNGIKQVEKAFKLKLTADSSTSWWQDNSAELAGWANPRIGQIITASDLKNYIQSEPTINSMSTSYWIYDNDLDTYTGCSASNGGGANIYIYEFPDQAVAQIVDNEIDDGNLSCGRLTYLSSNSSLRYNLSTSSAL